MGTASVFSEDLLKKIRYKFHYIDNDPFRGRRLYFDNAAGSLRLKSVTDKIAEVESFPDTPERTELNDIYEKGIRDIHLMFNAKEGSIITDISASQVMFKMMETVIRYIPGNNVVVSEGDHPSSYDSGKMFAEIMGKEFRVAKIDRDTGVPNSEHICELVDENTSVLSFILGSNVTGEVSNISKIIKCAREINPNLFIIVDGVQYIPHNYVDMNKLKIDGINFAPYKYFANRGIGVGLISKRLAGLPHHGLLLQDRYSWKVGSAVPSSFAAISEVVDYVKWIGSNFIHTNNQRELFVEGMTKINNHERTLLFRLLNGSEKVSGLKKISGVRLLFNNTDLTTKELLVGFQFTNISMSEALKKLMDEGVIVSGWDDNSIFFSRQLKAMGVKGFIRVTPMHYHSYEDIDRFLLTIKKLSKI